MQTNNRWMIATLVLGLVAACSDDSATADAGVDGAHEASVTDGATADGGEAGTPDGSPAPCVAPPWAPGTPRWGGPCRSAADCPSPANVTTFCEVYTGGHCLEKGGPDFAGEGQPCASDALSVGVLIGSFGHCLAACASDGDCRPGYVCQDGLGQGGAVKACRPIADCATGGCNEGASTAPYRCELEDTLSQCWVDGCAGDPCADDPFSSGACNNVGDARQCECVSGTAWDPQCQRCDVLRCGAESLVAGADGSLSGSGDTCGLDALFDPTAVGCTGWDEPGPEQLFRFTVPPQSVATVAAGATTSFDIALYVLEDCFDFETLTCLGGRDMAGVETVKVVNEQSTPRELFAVVDGAGIESCGEFDIAVSFAGFSCGAADLGTFEGSTIERLGESNCEGSELYDPGLGGCTGQHAAGKEQLYEITLPAKTSVKVTMDLQSSFDGALYVLERCGDYNVASCGNGMGADAGQFGVTESLVLENSESNAKVFFIVADSFQIFSGCGDYDLRVEAMEG